MAATQAAVADVTIDGSESLRWWNATEEVQYGFCGECGSSLFWRRSDQANLMSIAAGTLDKPTKLSTTKAYFTDYASDYHVLDDTVEKTPYDASRQRHDPA